MNNRDQRESGRLPARIGRYQIEREVGRGGHGVVYRAKDTRLRRPVALKVLAGALFFAGTSQSRLFREARAASQFSHPGICSVYEVGEERGVPYIAMRYVDGETLSRKIAMARGAQGGDNSASFFELFPSGDPEQPDKDIVDSRSSGPRTHRAIMQVVELIEKAARALHVAHEASLIHRDIKPGNIMVTPEGEPVILDFGLARVEESDLPTLTGPGELVGTPAYMSPEQLTAGRDTLDRRTDVYSLGVTLYECLTLRRPFVGQTREHLFQRILGSEPRNPRRLNRSIPRDLRVILETALAKDRERRYGSALDFAEDLRRLRENEPTVARPLGPVGRVLRYTKRRPARAALLGMLIICLPLLVAMGAYLVLTQPVIEDQRRRVQQETVENHLREAASGLLGEDPTPALDSLNKVLAIDPEQKEALFEKAMVLVMHGKDRECRAFLDTHIDATALDPRLQLIRAHFLKVDGRFDEAAALEARIPASGTLLPLILPLIRRWGPPSGPDDSLWNDRLVDLSGEAMFSGLTRLFGDGARCPAATVCLSLLATKGAGLPYQLAAFFRGSPNPAGQPELGVGANSLRHVTPCGGWLAISPMDRGTLSENGQATVKIRIPSTPAIVGGTICIGFVTMDSSRPLHIKSISNAHSFTIEQAKGGIGAQARSRSFGKAPGRQRDHWNWHPPPLDQVFNSRPRAVERARSSRTVGRGEHGTNSDPPFIPDQEMIDQWVREKRDSDRDMVTVPAGRYTVGGREPGCYPQRVHHLKKPFKIDRFEVTNHDWFMFLWATKDSMDLSANIPYVEGSRHPDGWDPTSRTFQYDHRNRAKHPVRGISWTDARSFARFLKKRLPDDREWEIAARGPQGLRYPWGNEYALADWKTKAWTSFMMEPEAGERANRSAMEFLFDTVPVDRLAEGQSPFGCFNMAGNVSEFTRVFMTSRHRNWRDLPDEERPNTVMVKGGSFMSSQRGALAAYYSEAIPNIASDLFRVGFRCVRD